ncbi:hypothetical protein D9M73_262240 [compost metagenome]
MLQHHHTTGVLLLGDEETCTQCPDFTLGGAHAQRTVRIGRDPNHQFAVAQDDQPLLAVELQVHRAVGVEAQAAAVGQVEILALPPSGGQVGE